MSIQVSVYVVCMLMLKILTNIKHFSVDNNVIKKRLQNIINYDGC